jgi:hypothetical protein
MVSCHSPFDWHLIDSKLASKPGSHDTEAEASYVFTPGVSKRIVPLFITFTSPQSEIQYFQHYI